MYPTTETKWRVSASFPFFIWKTSSCRSTCAASNVSSFWKHTHKYDRMHRTLSKEPISKKKRKKSIHYQQNRSV